MNRSAAILALALAACSATPIPPPIQLAGPSSLAVAGKFLFVSSSGGSVLRVITGKESNPIFLRAPNPLYALQIPTAAMPGGVASYDPPPGSPFGVSPYVFAVSAIPTTSRNNANSGKVHGTVSVATTDLLTWLGDLDVTGMIPLAVAAPAWAGGDVKVAIAGIAIDESGVKGNGALQVGSISPAFASNPTGLPTALPVTPTIDLGAFVPLALVASPNDPTLVAVGLRTADGLGGGVAIVNIAESTVTPVPEVTAPVAALAFSPEGVLFGATLVACSDNPAGPPECGSVFKYDPHPNATSHFTPMATGSLQIPAVPRGIAAGAADRPVTMRDPKNTAISPDVTQVVLVSAINGSIYAVDGSTVTTVHYLVSAGAQQTDTPFGVKVLTLSAPGAMLYLPATDLADMKPVFWVGFEGGNALGRIEPDRLTAGTSSGFTIRE